MQYRDRRNYRGAMPALTSGAAARGARPGARATPAARREAPRPSGIAARSQPTLLAAALLAAFAGGAHALPTGNQTIAGQGSVSSGGSTMTVNQQSQSLILNWQGFSIGSGETVRFVQPSTSAVALNRVIGNSASSIYGSLSANGQVFLVNPSGVLFGAGAQVDVGGLVASTLNIGDADFLAGNASGRYRFAANAPVPAGIVNQGSLKAAPGGYIALLGGQASNQGVIQARLGTAVLAAGGAMTLDFAGNRLMQVQIDQGALGALAENRQLINADGGSVLMTAYARDAVLDTVVNNSGIIEARTLDSQGGTIRLLGGMAGGTVQVGGTLDVSAPAGFNPNGGAGGFIETSGMHLKIDGGARIQLGAARGRAGKWLIDPTDITIDGGAAAALVTALNGGGTATVTTASGGTDAGDITVASALTWSGSGTLELIADRDIAINAPVTGSNGGLTLNAAGGISAPAAVNVGTFILQNGNWSQLAASLPAFSATDFRLPGGSFLRALGGDGSTAAPYRLADVYGLQGVGSNNMPNQNFLLAGDINAGGTAAWNGGAGFSPITPFNASFDGGGHRITGLTINRPGSDYVGLFGQIPWGATVSNLGLTGANITGHNYVGVLAGNVGGSVSASYSTGSVSGTDLIGGLIGGTAAATLTSVYSEAAVSGVNNVGGLVGANYFGSLTGAYATGHVSASGDQSGGLLGYLMDGVVSNVYATGAVDAPNDLLYTGSLIGVAGGPMFAQIHSAFASGAVNGSPGALVGMNVMMSWNFSDLACCVSGAQLFQQATYPNFDFVNTWTMIEGSTMPTLRAIPPPMVTPPATPPAAADPAPAAPPASVPLALTDTPAYAGALNYAGHPDGGTGGGTAGLATDAGGSDAEQKARGGIKVGGLGLTIVDGGIRLPDGVAAQ